MRILPEEKHKAFPTPKKTLPRIKGTPHQDFFRGCPGESVPASNFVEASKLTEMVLLGNMAQRAGLGKKVEWDGPNMKVTNRSELNKYLQHDYRKGWEF